LSRLNAERFAKIGSGQTQGKHWFAKTGSGQERARAPCPSASSGASSRGCRGARRLCSCSRLPSHIFTERLFPCELKIQRAFAQTGSGQAQGKRCFAKTGSGQSASQPRGGGGGGGGGGGKQLQVRLACLEGVRPPRGPSSKAAPATGRAVSPTGLRAGSHTVSLSLPLSLSRSLCLSPALSLVPASRRQRETEQ
jgi:hypothetical protein